jgi:hypothetical protein
VLLGEFAPFIVPQFDALIVSLGALCLLVVCLGLIAAARAFLSSIFVVAETGVSWIPWVGKLIKAPIAKVEQKLIHSLGVAELAVDVKIGAYWHSLVRLALWTVDEIRRHANLLYLLSTVMLGPEVTALIKQGVALARREIHAATAQLHRLERAITHGLPADIAALRHWTAARLHSITATLDHTLDKAIPSLRVRTRTLEREYEVLWHKVKGLDKLLGIATFTATVAFALSRLGLGWLLCPSLGRLGKRVGCGGFALLEKLLFGLIDVLLIADICQVTKAMVKGAQLAQPILSDLIAGIDDLLLCQGAERPVDVELRGRAGPTGTVWSDLTPAT